VTLRLRLRNNYRDAAFLIAPYNRVSHSAGVMMDELAGRLEVLIRRHAQAWEQREDESDQVVVQFQKQFRLLIAQFGEGAVKDALERFRAGPARPSVSLH
jgi:hypothetical protein